MSYIASWSGGKESCFAVYQAIKQGYKISCLVNFIYGNSGRVNFHGTEPGLIQLQSRLTGIPLLQRETTWNGYEAEFKETVKSLIPNGIEGMVFGDIYVQEHKDWVERVCGELNIKSIEPLWGRNTDTIMAEFIEYGFKSVIISARADVIDEMWLGKTIDSKFVNYLKSNDIDVCGENGEYHTLVVDGPIFQRPVDIIETRVIARDNYRLLDIIRYA